jgi:NAD(P)H dehydrogenase (quinone)
MKQESQKNILLILGHPASQSFCGLLASVYESAAKSSGFNVETIQIGSLDFNPNLGNGYENRTETSLEKDIERCQYLITWAHHLVFVYPTWWGAQPALLKGWIDRVFLPGFAFKYRTDSPLPEKLLKGKTARVITTMGAPAWYYRWVYGAPGDKLLKKAVLEFCGIKPVSVTHIGQARHISEVNKKAVLKKIEQLGQAGI